MLIITLALEGWIWTQTPMEPDLIRKLIIKIKVCEKDKGYETNGGSLWRWWFRKLSPLEIFMTFFNFIYLFQI